MVSNYIKNIRPETLPSGGVISPQNVQEIAQEWIDRFRSATKTAKAVEFDDLIARNGFWRDIISFTNDYRSIAKPNVLQAAKDLLKPGFVENVWLDERRPPEIQTPFPGYSFVEFFISFDTTIGPCIGVVKLIQDFDEKYRAFVLFTTLTGVHGRPFQENELRPRGIHNTESSYNELRCEETENIKPSVIIVGAGHNGLEAAAHLKALGIPTLVIDRGKRIGDNWRLRYKSLSLHDPVWANHLSYLPFPSTWPVFTPSGKLANWLEYYADILELTVWNSTELVRNESHYDSTGKTWTISLSRDGKKHVFTEVSHIILATGLGGGHPKIPPPFENQNEFQGKIVHSSGHESGANWVGKKALVVGACTSAHDICADLANHKVDVTMLQRSPTFVMSVEKGMPIINGESGLDTETGDFLGESIPKYVVKLYHEKLMKRVFKADAALLSGLEKAGFRTSEGEDRSGFLMSALEKAGGYYFDTGASQKIIEGDIKIQQGEIARFGRKGVVLKNGTEVETDIVVFATGYTGFKNTVDEILGPKYAEKLTEIWGLDEEGELNGVCRDCGIPRCFYIVGNLSAARFNTKITALQVAAEQKYGDLPRYSIQKQKASF